MQLVRESIYDDVHYLNVLNESLINEDFSIQKVKDAISKLSDKKQALHNFIKKFNETKSFNIKKNIAIILATLFLINFVGRNNSIADISRLSNEITKEEIIDVNKLEEISEKSLQPIIENPINYLTAKTSKVTRDSIKHHEKLRLTAYVVGKDDDTDKKITIGYGHAYPENASPYNVGDEITLSEAEKLFLQDIHKSENGIKRMLSRWEKEGITIKLNQQMFDSMVSMAFNMGISGFMQTEFVKHLKKGDYKTAAEKIKTARVSSKFPGLTKRREQEHRMFVKNIIYK